MALPFEGVFGNNCELRVMEFLLPLRSMEFNITELAEEAGITVRVTRTLMLSSEDKVRLARECVVGA